MDTTACHLPIQTLCVVSTVGDLKPIWFRYEDEEHIIKRVDICEILTKKETALAGRKSLVFTCAATLDDISAIVELQYMIDTHKWVLKRKIT